MVLKKMYFLLTYVFFFIKVVIVFVCD